MKSLILEPGGPSGCNLPSGPTRRAPADPRTAAPDLAVWGGRLGDARPETAAFPGLTLLVLGAAAVVVTRLERREPVPGVRVADERDPQRVVVRGGGAARAADGARVGRVDSAGLLGRGVVARAAGVEGLRVPAVVVVDARLVDGRLGGSRPLDARELRALGAGPGRGGAEAVGVLDGGSGNHGVDIGRGLAGGGQGTQPCGGAPGRGGADQEDAQGPARSR